MSGEISFTYNNAAQIVVAETIELAIIESFVYNGGGKFRSNDLNKGDVDL
jgi:hypothetical protein